jgi:hypothetical protein
MNSIFDKLHDTNNLQLCVYECVGSQTPRRLFQIRGEVLKRQFGVILSTIL